MTSIEQRRERVRNGSRRKRDLDASKPVLDWNAYIAQHFPGEFYAHALAAAQHVFLARPPRERALPDPVAVRARMRAKGWLREQMGAEPCP